MTPSLSPSPAPLTIPAAPLTGSHVPILTSLHSAPVRGPWGDWRYPGNCSGYLVRDLLTFFRARRVLDPMTGSGTCADVCRDLRIPCTSGDLRSGFDAGDARSFEGLPQFDFIWLHPPYWRMKRYSADPRDLSAAKSVCDFYAGLQRAVVNCLGVLAPGGKLAILMGDYFDSIERRQIPCVQMSKDICLRLGFWPACTDIIKFQHNIRSSRKTYSTAFVPCLHEVCMVFSRDSDSSPQ